MIRSLIGFVSLALALLCGVANAQQATTGLPSPQLSGTGVPSFSCASGSSYMGLSYIQTDAVNGKLWLCDQASGTWGWDQQLSAIKGIGNTSTITGGAFILGGCTTATTVTLAGAVVGTNAAAASPIYVSAPTGNQGLFNLTAWVSAANTVTVQGCGLGTITIPNFQAKVFLY